MKKIMLTLVLFFFIVAIIIAYFLFKINTLNQELVHLRKESGDMNQALKQNKQYISSLQTQIQAQLRKNVSDLREKQTPELTNTKKESDVHISAVEVQFSPSTKTIAFWVNGPDGVVFDAMDLSLALTNMGEKPDCITGDVFSQYPLIDSKDESISITGIAGINTEKITGGTINKKFVTCTFEKKNALQQATIKLNPDRTHIYSLGKSVLNLESSFKNISW